MRTMTAGQAGVEHALGILETELKAVMQLTGCVTVADICEQHLHDRGGPHLPRSAL